MPQHSCPPTVIETDRKLLLPASLGKLLLGTLRSPAEPSPSLCAGQTLCLCVLQLVEVTPQSVRMRKDPNAKKKGK